MKTVFIVEDEAIVALEIQDHLREGGYVVCGRAASGEMALEKIPEARPHLVLMDIHLGKGMSGLETAERLRSLVDVPVLFLTAFSDAETSQCVANTGSFGYITKPFDPRVLLANVELALVRHQAAVTMRDSEARYRTLFDQAIEGMFLTQVDGTIVAVNAAFTRIVGYDSPQELVGSNMARFYRTTAAQQFLPSPSGDRSTIERVELEWRTREGAPIVIELHGRFIFDEDGAPYRYQGFVRDVTTEQLHARTRKVLSTGLVDVHGPAFFEKIAENLATIVGAEIGFVGAVLPDAPPRIRTLGFVMDGKTSPAVEYALVGTPCEKVVAGCLTIFAHGVQQLFPTDRDLTTLGAEAYAAAPMIGTQGQVLGHVGIMARSALAHAEDVEEVLRLFALRTGAELERQYAEEVHSAVFEFAPDALLIVDETGHLVQVNRMTSRILGYSHDELLNLTVEDLVPEEERAQHTRRRMAFHAHAVARRMGTSRSRLWARRKDGAHVPVEISLSPVQAARRRLVVAAVRDVTERIHAEEEKVRLEDQLRQAQKMEALGTLAGGIAHDFNNMLAVIVGNADLARRVAAPGSPVAESLDEIAAASSRARDLVRQILAFSRHQPTHRIVAHVGTVFDEVVKLLRATLPAGIQIVAHAAHDHPPALIDPTRIHQVLMNLGTNAWHAIENPTGTITFLLDAVTIEAASASAEIGPGRYVRIQVSDDGTGMDATTLDRIFEPFFTTKEVGKGTGLGLAVVHGIVTDHDGIITVDSTPGGGTTFSVYLPEAVGQATSLKPAQSTMHQGIGRVLLVDDEKSVLRAATRMLERMGYQVSPFFRAADALEAVRADPHRFDVIVTDQNMPEVGGLEIARTLLTIRPDLPVVLISGNRVNSDQELAETNVRATVDKPFTLASLSHAIRRVLGRT